MKKLFYKIRAIFAVLIILFPSAAKFEHHHDHFTHPDSTLFTKVHSHDCPICKFEFSSFLEQEATSITEKTIQYCKKTSDAVSFCIYIPSFYSFALRAPPFFVV